MDSIKTLEFKCDECHEAPIMCHKEYYDHMKEHMSGKMLIQCQCGFKNTEAVFMQNHLIIIDKDLPPLPEQLNRKNYCKEQKLNCSQCKLTLKCGDIFDHKCLVDEKNQTLDNLLKAKLQKIEDDRIRELKRIEEEKKKELQRIEDERKKELQRIEDENMKMVIDGYFCGID